MKRKKIESSIIKKSQLEGLMNYLSVSAEYRTEIKSHGAGSHIFHTLESRNEVETLILLEYFEIYRLHIDLLNALSRATGDVKVIERLQTFARLKIKGRPQVGRLFEFMEANKERLCIQQYTIKQASVEQIFNQFAG
jgi:ATP-binding cassette, subfamily A (ABC1), member 3